MASHQQTMFIQFENWSTQEVANWLHGLDESVAQYVPLFQINGVDGRRLMMLNHSDLEKMSIKKLGHQELVLEAVDLLRSLRYTLETENLQSMALHLGCKARNVVAELQTQQGENDQNRANLQRRETQWKRLTTTVLSYVADVLATLKNLVSWLDRAPFEGIYDICRLRNSVVKLGIEMVMVTQRESSFMDPEETIIKSCRTLIEYCDGLVQKSKDPLVIQPAALEQATIRKKQGEELGMNIQSAYNGIHKISSIKELSPADMCSKIEKGDEVLQVNGQTVLGWQLKELVKILKDKPKEVTLLLKKRPRHINPLGAMQNHRRLAAKHAQQAATLPKSLKKRRSREGDSKQTRPSLQEFVSTTGSPGDDIYITKDKPEATEGDGNDTDNDVFRSGSESPQYTLPVMPDAKQRRATVSGGSPTFERNSLMVDDPVIRPKSQFINQAERDAALAILAASETSLKIKASESEGKEGPKRSDGGAVTTSSESSSGYKRPSESEVEDSVFSSDKEDQPNPSQQEPDVKPQEFRVTKPTPTLVEPAARVAIPMSPLAKTLSSSSSVSSSVSSSTLIHSPNPASNAGAGNSATDPSSSTPDGSQSSSVQPSVTRCRPPSPVSAPPRRKKSLTTILTSDGRPDVVRTAGQSEAVVRVSEHSRVMTPSPLAASPVTKTAEIWVPSATAAVAALEANSKWEAQHTGRQAESRSSSSRPTFPPRESRRESLPREGGQVGSKPSEDASNRGADIRRGDKSKPAVWESAGVAQDHRPQSVQQAIHTEVATDTPHKDAPQLMKMKKLESPKATDTPDVPAELGGTPKQKKKVEFSPDAKESSPPHEVSYTHIVVGGVVQKIPIDSTSTDSPPVKLRQKSGNRRLDRRVSCKDLGKGDCEGWLYKRKEKDHRLSKHWSKRWCVLKNYNLYYYKNKEELKAEGVIYLPAFQVSPAMDLKTKKFPFKVHNAGTTFYFASERQDDMSKWMNKMGLAAISFDTSQVVTTGGFIKPEPRSNHLGMANAYYSESEEEVEEGSSLHGSVLSLNSVSSLGSATVPHPSPPLFKRAVHSVSSDPGALGDGAPPHAGQQRQATGATGGSKGERLGSSRI